MSATASLGAMTRRTPAPLIAHIIHRLDVGGLENGVVNLINAMPEHAYRHAIICMKDFTEFRRRIRRTDVEVYALHKREGKDPGAYWRLYRLLRTLRPTIAHTRNLTTLDCQFVAALAGVPRRVHGEHGWDAIDVDGTSARYNRLRRAMRPFIHRYIPLSVEIENWLRATVRVPAHKLQRIYNGVNAERFAARPDGIARPDGPFVIGTVGRMQTVKNQPALAHAFVRLVRMLDASTHPVRLVMVGDGPLRAEVERVVNEAGIAPLVEMRGTRDSIPDEMRAIDLFVLPSIAEGISNTILEAMACGVPVVATNVGGNAELVTDGKTGRIIPHSDAEAMAQAMYAYVTDPERARAHGRAGRERVLRDFSMERMVGAYATVYDELIGARRVAA